MTSSRSRNLCPHISLCFMFLYLFYLFAHFLIQTAACALYVLHLFACTFKHCACAKIASIACQQLGWFMSLDREHSRQTQVDINFVNLLLLILPHSYQTGYWRADKARMSSVSLEESPVFNCSSLLTTSRDQDSECVRLGPAGWWCWEFRTYWWRDRALWEEVGVHGHMFTQGWKVFILTGGHSLDWRDIRCHFKS